MAAGDEIFPGGLAGARPRNNVIKGELDGWGRAETILAGVAIPHEDVFSGECASLVRNPAVFEQPDLRFTMDGVVACGSDLKIVSNERSLFT
jgi:hypothetical protein